MLLRLVYLAVTNTFSLIRLLPVSRRELEVEILVLRHQLAVLRRQSAKPRFTVEDRALLAGLLHGLPRQTGRSRTKVMRRIIAELSLELEQAKAELGAAAGVARLPVRTDPSGTARRD